MLFRESGFLTLTRRCRTNVHSGTINRHKWTIHGTCHPCHYHSVVKGHLEAQTTEQDQWLRVCKHLGSQSCGRYLPPAIYRANCYNANENVMLQIPRFSVLSACYTGHLAALVYFQGPLRKKQAMTQHAFLPLVRGHQTPSGAAWWKRLRSSFSGSLSCATFKLFVYFAPSSFQLPVMKQEELQF